MNRPGNERQVDAAVQTLMQIHEQAEEARAELLGLRQNLMEVHRDFGDVRAKELREANEHLVLAVLRAETIADNALASLDQMARASQRDALTNTANRVLIMDRLENAIALAQRHGTRFAVCFVDLDDFKQVNDTLGHTAGDKVLQQAARHLQAIVRDSDTVSRYGGDEFLVLLADVTEVADAATVAGKMLAAIAASNHADGHVLHLSASIGIALYPDDATDAVTLVSRADAAMYRSKRRQRGSFMFCDETCDPSKSELAVGESLQRLATRCESTMAAHDLHLHHLREANEHLVLSALTAQELVAHNKQERTHQIASLAMVAHELRSPLTPIRTAVEVIGRMHPGEPLIDELQALIIGQVALMTRLVDDLLDGSRANTCRFRLERRNVEMTGILDRAIATCRPAMNIKLQQFKVQLPRRRLIVYGDPMRLTQVFSNLLTNASKYTPVGGRIALMAKVLGHSMIITVADSGIGIIEETLPHIFELFVRDKHAIALDTRGLGIGLTVVRDLVEAHGGTVVATSAGMNRGSEFVITLPLAARRNVHSI